MLGSKYLQYMSLVWMLYIIMLTGGERILGVVLTVGRARVSHRRYCAGRIACWPPVPCLHDSNTTQPYIWKTRCVCKHYFPQRLPKLYSIPLQKSLHYFCVYKNLKCYNFHFSIWLKSVRNNYFHNYLYISFKKSIYYYYISRCSREIT